MKNILNIAGYKFIALDRLSTLREQLKQLCQSNGLKGTILLGTEGINLMLAGNENQIINFLQQFNQDVRFSNIEYKRNYSEFVPFKRLLVKVKKEIVTFGVADINPEKFTAPSISPQQFKQWLEDNKDMTVLDVRNECEIEIGTFDKAIHLGIKNFRSFSKAAKQLPASTKQKPMVMFCTGGIRCEKASAYLLQQGFNEVYQLHGGILNYFAECGSEHYKGSCFVFDDRIAVGSK